MGKWFGNTTWKQRTNVRKIHRALGILLAMALVFQMVPFASTAVSASENSGGGLCTHHRSHTPDCGYKEAEPGHGCTHEHTEDCYRIVEDCIHEHAESCYPADNASESEATPADAEEKQPTECSHSCSGDSGCITKEPDCQHEHDDSCGYRVGTPGTPCTFICEICNGGISEDDGKENNSEAETPGTETGDETKEPDGEPAGKPDNGQEKCICEEPCEESSGNEGGRVNKECPVCGAEDAGLSDCKGKVVEEDMAQPEDTGICKHHQEHDDACGYQPESEDSEGSPCTYECRICPIEDLIAALPDKVTEDNADEVRAQLDHILDLYRELNEGEQEKIDISHCLELQEALDAVNVSALAVEGTPDLELFGQEVRSGDSGEGWSYADGVLTLENFHSDSSSENFIHITNSDLEFTLHVKGDNSVKTSGKLIWGSVYGSMTITGEQGASLSLDGKSWSDRYIFIRGVNMDVTMQEMIFLAYDMEIDNATVNFNMNGSNGYIYTTHGGFTIKNGSDVTITNSSGAVDYCVATNKAVITDSALKVTNPSGFGVYVTNISTQVSEYKAFITNSTISADVSNAAIHCEDEMAVTNSQVTGIGRFLLRSKKAITVDDSSTMEGITYEFFKSDTGATYQVYGSHTPAANLTVAEKDSFVIPEGAVLAIPDGIIIENNGTMRIHEKDSLTGTGVLTGNGKFLIDVNEDMISVPEGLVYTGKDYTDQIILEENATVCGVEFTADTEGWTRNIEPAVVKEAGEYTVTFTSGNKEISKTFTVAQSGTDLTSEGKVKIYNGSEETTSFTAGDTIKVVAAPTPTGKAPQKAAARLPADPDAGQMAMYVGNNIVSNAVEVAADGSYTMTVSADDVLIYGQEGENGKYTLIAKFVGNTNMADAEAQVEVTITPNPLTADMVTMSAESGTYSGTEQKPTVTVTGLTEGTDYEITYTGNFTSAGEHTLTVTGKGVYRGTVEKTYTIGKATPTIAWANNVVTLTYTGQPADIKPVVTLVNGETFSGTITYHHTNTDSSESGESKAGLPTNAGIYGVGARIPEQDNYTAATTAFLMLMINKADQTVPAAPTAAEDNIKDNSITLDTIENAEYKRDDGEWQESPTFTGLEPNRAYMFYARLKEDDNHNASPDSAAASITTKKTMLENASVTITGTYTYIGAAIIPEAGNVEVVLNGTKIDSDQYTISASNNINAGVGKATLTVTATETGNYSGSVSSTFTINRADLTVKANDQVITYGGNIATGTDQVTPTGLVGGDTLESVTLEASSDQVAVADKTITPSAAVIKRGGEDVTANYNITYQPGTLTISYMDAPGLQYNGSDKKEYYNRDVAVTAVPAGGHTYMVSDTLGGNYEASYTISAQEGTVTKTLYFKDEAGHMSDGVEVTVKFDLTPPTGEIAVGAKWWQNVLHFISFGNYAAKEYTVTIKAEDKKGSGISKIEYAIVTGGSQYTDADTLKAANLSWKEYNSGSRPTVPVSNSQYVVYARLTDNVGNVTYISTDGILLDNTPPTVGSLSVPEDTRKDVTAGFTFTVSEAADYYYVVLPKDSAAPDPEDIIVTCGGTLPEGTGTAISGTFPKGSGAVSADTLPASVSVEAENLSPNTAYTVYVTAVDRAVDITDSAEGTPAGNIAAVQNVDFTTKKTLPVITKAPAVAGTYGQSVGEMTVTGGTAQAGSTVLVGTWTVSDADKNEKPSAGTSEVTVIFKPDNANYDSVSVQASLTVSQRNLNAEGVTVSEVAGTYTYTGSEIRPPVAVGTGTPAAGIYISDSGAALTASDFTVSYSNHKDAGTASVTITGKGNYTGSVTRTFTIGKAPGREVPDVSGSYTDNGQTYTYTVTPTEGAVYRMGNDGKWQEENVFEGITPGTSVTFYAKMPETGNYEDGTPKSITVDFPKLTPAAPALSYKADRTNPADVKVTITPVSGAEYSFDGGKTWTESNEQGGFTTSDTVTLAIRLKETDTHNQSPVQTVTVNLAKKDREAPPAFSLKVEANGETDYTVTIPATEGCEYSFDGEHWSDVNVKTGVSVGETVTGYKRYKETNDYNASSAVSAKETMPKFTVKTPVISPAGGSYEGNVSVTITCASPDAEIYYTTDGSAPGRGSTRYTGAFTVTAPATVKAIAVKEGLTDSAEASVTYTKKSDSGSGSGGNGGGNSGGNEDNGGQGSGGGGSTNPGNGSTTPPIPVIPPAENINPGNGATPGTGTTPVNPGTENTVRPGSGAGTPVQGAKQPFIKGEDGKIGWGVIRAEEEKAQEGSTINVDMNGSTVVPGDIFDSIKGKDITITFDMGSGILWSVDGKSITTDKAGDIDFSVKTGVNTVPVDIINNVTGESYSIQISLAYEGEFGFTAVLSIGLGKENAGYTASLYYYNESTGELEFICKDQIAEDGTVSLAFTHASDYVIAVDIEAMDGKEGVDNTPETPRTGDYSIIADVKENDEATWIYKLVIAVGTIVVVAGFGIIFIWKKKKEEQ